MQVTESVVVAIRSARLRFADPEMEARFRRESDAAGRPYTRVAGSLGALIVLLFGVLDIELAPDDLGALWTIRAVTAGYAIVVVALTFRLAPATLERLQQPLVASVTVVVAAGQALVPHVSSVPTSYWTTGVFLVLMVTFTSARLRFVPALVAAGFVVAIVEMSLVLKGLDWVTVAYGNFFLLSFLAVGASTCYALERLLRREFLHEEALRGAFGSYVSPDLVDRVTSGDAHIAGEEVEVTVLFADIRGFTSLADRMTPAETVAVLSDFYELVLPIVRRHGGHANKLLGDGLLAVFGAPIALDDHADRALAAASEMIAATWRRYEGELRIGIGLSSGTVVAGTIGDPGKLDYTLIGDAVNVAARVEQLTKETGDPVLLSDETRRRLKGAWSVEERGHRHLRGKQRPIGIHALVLVPPGAPAAIAEPAAAAREAPEPV